MPPATLPHGKVKNTLKNKAFLRGYPCRIANRLQKSSANEGHDSSIRAVCEFCETSRWLERLTQPSVFLVEQTGQRLNFY